jgi:type I restriction enzyme S subunit
MPEVRLAELVRAAGSRAGAETDLPVYSVTKHAGFVPSLEYFKKQVFSRDVAGYKLVDSGDFAYATIHLDEGSIGIAPERALISPMYTVFAIDDSRVDRSYLIRFLKSPRALAQYTRLGNGAVHRRKAISLAALGALEVPLPPLRQQRKIAAILDRADILRARRRQVLTHLDDLTHSIFHDMFGDPIRNNRNLPQVELGSVADVETGNSPPRSDDANFGDSIEWIKSRNLGGDVATVAVEWLSEKGRRRARVAPPGSVLVTCIAGSPTSIGKASIVDREVAFNQQINAVLPSDDLNTVFLLGQLKIAPDLVRAKSSGGMKGLVNKSDFKSIDILLPSREDQRKFARRWKDISVQRAVSVAGQTALNDLFASLQTRAFRGQL